MKIKTLKCPNCNAKIDLKEGEVNGICSYCNTPFIIEDDVIHVEHEIINDTSLKIAETTLNKFKDYRKAENLYRSLLYKYAHKEEVYIGLIRCITNDFKKPVETLSSMREINSHWAKYKTLTKNLNIAQYQNAINKLNREFYLQILKKETEDFTKIKMHIKPNTIKDYWENYKNSCEKKEYLKIEKEYKDYINDLETYVTKKKKRNKFILKTAFIILLILLIGTPLCMVTETPHKKSSQIKTSNLYKYCDPNFKCDQENLTKALFYPTIGKIKVLNSNFNKDENTLAIEINLKNKLRDVTKKYKFKITDDNGPYIKELNCKFTDTEDIDLNKCFELIDYTDGKLDNDIATIDKLNLKEHKLGNYKIKVTAKDKENITSSKKINVEIIKTPIKLDVNFENENLEINKTTKLSYEITPDVNDKNVKISYDKEYVSVEDNVITPKKLGKTKICVTADYNNTKTCKELKITPICKDSYTFTFTGDAEQKIVAGKDFCSGTYKVYANVLNNNDVYTMIFEGSDGHFMNFFTINKKSPFNNEGKQYIFADNAYIPYESGVTSITLVK